MRAPRESSPRLARLRWAASSLAALGLLVASRANAQQPPGPPVAPPATPGPECADARVGGVCDDPARLARIESYRAPFDASAASERIALLAVLLPGVAGATALGSYALTAHNQPTGYYVGAGIVTGIGGISVITAAIAFLTSAPSTPSTRPTTRQWEAEVAQSYGNAGFVAYLALPAVLVSLAAVPGGIYIMAERKSFPTAPDGPRIALGGGTALLGGIVLTAVGFGVVDTIRAGRVVRAIEPPRPAKQSWNVRPIVSRVAGGALVGVGGVWF
jgi:hypothetical protein